MERPGRAKKSTLCGTKPEESERKHFRVFCVPNQSSLFIFVKQIFYFYGIRLLDSRDLLLQNPDDPCAPFCILCGFKYLLNAAHFSLLSLSV